MSLTKGIRAVAQSPSHCKAVTMDTLRTVGYPTGGSVQTGETLARKLSAVDRCIEILSDSMGKLPAYLMDSHTRKRVDDPVLILLNIRPNEAMTPLVRKKLLETSRLIYGNSYDWIVRNPRTGAIQELIPIPGNLVQPYRDRSGCIWYAVTNPQNGAYMVLHNTDICHYKGASRDGLNGMSVLRRACEVIATAQAQQKYEQGYYLSGGQPAGILRTETDLSGLVQDPANPEEQIGKKDLLRREWERIHAGPNNSHRIAILDYGLDYKPIAISNQDAQLIESKEILIRDIARYFGVPLYKLQEGDQSYDSNEQNSIEYVVGTLHPIVTQYEEEQTYKLLLSSQVDAGLELRINMMAELRGDTNSRQEWYKTMRQEGVYSVNDIRQLEDMEDVPGGDERLASLNYVPLSSWAELVQMRAANQNSKGAEHG